MRLIAAVLLLALPAAAADSTDMKRAIELPRRADGLRQAGIEPDQVREALKAAREADLGADEAEELLDNEEKAVREHGPVDNFGAFVQEQLKQGKRGKELAQAIREEHARQGKGKDKAKNGKGKSKNGGDDHGDEKGDKAKNGKGGGDKDKGNGGGKGGKGKGGKGKGGKNQ